MLKAILKLLKLHRSERNIEVDKLYYLYGIKPIKINRSVIDECTVTK